MARQSLAPFRPGRGGIVDPFALLQREMNRLFEDVLPDAGLTGGQAGGALVPRIEVSETEGEIRITAEMPGVAERDVEVTLDGDLLTIRGEKRLEREEERRDLHVTERAYGTFQRSLRLPFAADPEQVQARFEGGVLTTVLPKTQAQQRSRRVQVQGQGDAASQGQGAQGNGQGGRETTGQGGAAAASGQPGTAAGPGG